MKTVIITGASSGYGKTCAELFSEKGYAVVLFARSKDKLQDVANTLKDSLVVTGDVTDEADVKRLVKETVEKYASIDVLVNCAGMGIFKFIQDFTLEEFQTVMDTNVTGTFLAIKHVLPIMLKKDKGQIVNIGSISSRIAYKDGAAYAGSKWAVLGITQCVKAQLRDTHIKIAAVCPGSSDTPFFEKAGWSPPDPRKILKSSVIADAIYRIAEQDPTSDIDEVIIRPALR